MTPEEELTDFELWEKELPPPLFWTEDYQLERTVKTPGAASYTLSCLLLLAVICAPWVVIALLVTVVYWIVT